MLDNILQIPMVVEYIMVTTLITVLIDKPTLVLDFTKITGTVLISMVYSHVKYLIQKEIL